MAGVGGREVAAAERPRGRGWLRRLLWLGLISVGVLGLTAALGLATMDRWLWLALDPGPFDPRATPPAPDYAEPSAWAALPELEDGADVALPELPALPPGEAPADVFYVHPTTSLAPSWNAAIDDPAVVEATTRGGTLIQASVFNACCAVYAPRYRQAHGRAFTHPDEQGARAIEVAYADLEAALEAFLARTGERPFILAGHSQGSVLGARLLRERIAGSPAQARLVAAYLIGAPLRPGELGGLPVCEGPRATGCVVAYNARGPGYEPNALEFEADEPDAMRGLVCVNPLTWSQGPTHAPAGQNAGAIFFDIEAPRLEPGFADARCDEQGVLRVTELGELERDFMSRLLLWVVGPENYHPIEYQLFYVDLRRNARERVEAFAD